MSTRSPSSRRHSTSWTLIGSARRRSRPGRSTRTSGAGTPRSSPSDDRGTTNRVRGWNWSPCSMPSGRTGWSPISSSIRRCPTGSTSRVRLLGCRPIGKRSSWDPDVRHHPAAGPRGRSTRHAPPFHSRGGEFGYRPSVDVAAVGIAPDESRVGRHLVDDRVVLPESVRASVAGLRLTAADVPARRT